MSENRILISEIGNAQSLRTRRVELPFNSAASTLRFQMSHELEATLPDGSQQALGMKTFIKRIENRPHSAKANRSPAQQYMDKWFLALEADLPVAPTAIINDHELSIIDVSEGGIFFDKYMDLRLDPNFLEDFGPEAVHLEHPSFRRFLEMPKEKVEAAAAETIAIANSHHLWLPFDDPMNLLVLPDGRWRMLLLDPMNLQKYDEKKGKFVTEEEFPFLKRFKEFTIPELNEYVVEMFFKHLNKIRKRLRHLLY